MKRQQFPTQPDADMHTVVTQLLAEDRRNRVIDLVRQTLRSQLHPLTRSELLGAVTQRAQSTLLTPPSSNEVGAALHWLPVRYNFATKDAIPRLSLPGTFCIRN